MNALPISRSEQSNIGLRAASCSRDPEAVAQAQAQAQAIYDEIFEAYVKTEETSMCVTQHRSLQHLA
jgi:hypothetical protein